MKLFIDTADIAEIREAASLGLLDGVTTNPTLVAATAFLAGTLAAYVHVFVFDAPLLTPVLKGWSVLFPRITPPPARTPPGRRARARRRRRGQVPHGLVVPAGVLVERFSRSPGPGGQSVNTTDSRVELELELAAYDGFTPTQRRRVTAALGDRIVVAAREHRSQHRNRVAARERMAEAIRAALAPPPPARRATKPTRGSQERRLSAKRQRAETKASRSRPAPDT